MWDPAFYGISDKEALLIDPQQRMVLDCVQMALDDGGITKDDVSGTETGVYIGNNSLKPCHVLCEYLCKHYDSF